MMLLCCLKKESEALGERHTDTRTHSQHGLQAGTHSDPCIRQTEERRHREQEVEKSNMNSLLVK